MIFMVSLIVLTSAAISVCVIKLKGRNKLLKSQVPGLTKGLE